MEPAKCVYISHREGNRHVYPPSYTVGAAVKTTDLGPQICKHWGILLLTASFLLRMKVSIALWTFLRSGSPSDKLQGLRVREC